DSDNVYVPAEKPEPLDAPPAPEIGVGPAAVRVHSVATRVPPLLFVTYLMSTRDGAMSSFVTVHVFVSPTAIELLQSPEKLGEYPAGPVSATPYAPGFRSTMVPAASAPAKVPGEGEDPTTLMVKSAATAAPPLSLITCLMTMRTGETSSFVTVHVLVCPRAIKPTQSAEKLAEDPVGLDSPTPYKPSSRVTVVPAS